MPDELFLAGVSMAFVASIAEVTEGNYLGPACGVVCLSLQDRSALFYTAMLGG
jgi:hypothetical protein